MRAAGLVGPGVLGLCVVVGAVVAFGASPGERAAADAAGIPTVRAQLRPATGPAAPRAVGTLTYDNNTPFSRRGTDGGTVGNLFNTWVLDPHSIDTVSFRVAGNYADSVVMTVWDQNPGSFVVLRRQLVTGIPAGGGTNTVIAFTAVAPLATAIAAHNGAFVGGIRNTDYDPCAGNVGLNTTCDGVALTAGGVNPGLGFHGLRVPFNSGVFVPTITNVAGSGTSLGTVNAIFRVTGENFPVELMGFGVE